MSNSRFGTLSTSLRGEVKPDDPAFPASYPANLLTQMPSHAIYAQLALPLEQVPPRGFLIVNADDWGRDALTTDRIFDCTRAGAVSSVSAMVFMEDSARAASLAREHRVKSGLHLNLTTPFSVPGCAASLLQHQHKVARHLLRHRLAQAIFHPGLCTSFEYLVQAQLEEFERLYGTPAPKLDGHHHMHLSANVLLQRLLPPGIVVRRSFSFERGERSVLNRFYRRAVDCSLSGRHRMADFFFSLPPLEPAGRLPRIYALARHFVVELETHPVRPEEYRYLAGGEIIRQIGRVPIPPALAMPSLNGSMEKVRL